MSSLQKVATLEGHDEVVWDVAWHPNGRLLATASADRSVRIWQPEGKGSDAKWVCTAQLQGAHTRTVRSVAWRFDGKVLATASFDGTGAVWDMTTPEPTLVSPLEGHDNEVKSVCWSRSGNYVATCGRDKAVYVWELYEGEDEWECGAILNEHTQDVKRVTWHPTQDVLASASYDNTVKLYREDADSADWICTGSLDGHSSTVWCLAFDASGDRIVTGSDDMTVRVWRAYYAGNSEGIKTASAVDPTWKCTWTLSGVHSRCVYSVDWSKPSGMIATGCGDNDLRVFKETPESDPNAPTFEMIASCSAHSQDINGVAWSPIDGNTLATASDDGTACIWRVVTEEE